MPSITTTRHSTKNGRSIGHRRPVARHTQDRWIPLRVEVLGPKVTYWVDDILIEHLEHPQPVRGPVVLTLTLGDELRGLVLEPVKDHGCSCPFICKEKPTTGSEYRRTSDRRPSAACRLNCHGASAIM